MESNRSAGRPSSICRVSRSNSSDSRRNSKVLRSRCSPGTPSQKIPSVVTVGGVFLYGIWWITNRRKEVQDYEKKLHDLEHTSGKEKNIDSKRLK